MYFFSDMMKLAARDCFNFVSFFMLYFFGCGVYRGSCTVASRAPTHVRHPPTKLRKKKKHSTMSALPLNTQNPSSEKIGLSFLTVLGRTYPSFKLPFFDCLNHNTLSKIMQRFLLKKSPIGD